eukprot:CAMPEP_0197689772 /NCGR_PEP_ID=MMETSP1338-20131121/107366_1 /TAXON_ID=43686 ORGANISM="Pelagodinium beii, Strain RCC1491" /NCGR_SAMPLE_ID=MMETSP1338 /ASSEMBLY_ACC=CAM_ASM_000754 /LENGTH=127 /DNA_ID=CAMNT_0043272147 /DNA_START=33 /DNA_END=413 /DNA_ORIENTATION=+
MDLIELLVADHIVGLDLQVSEVHDQIWVPSILARRENLAEQAAAEGVQGRDGVAEDRSEAVPPMTVIFRLAGVDGEATEDRVESLVDASSDGAEAQRQVKRRKALCQAFNACGGAAVTVAELELALS